MAIRLLDERVVSQIAAGEVVERPASVVKELVENSLDAAATEINVEIRSGGISYIQVSDNGSGIAEDEVELAFARHATSKIQSLADLQKTSTLGFRGEALPSIAAAGQVEMLTCRRGAEAGVYLRAEEGQTTRKEDRVRSPGTTVTVHNLFHKIPARLKFLKSNLAEAGRVAEVVSEYALAYPEIKFRLISDGKTVLRTPGSAKLSDSIGAVYGVEVARQMLTVQDKQERQGAVLPGLAVHGLVSPPSLSRSNRDYLSLFVNRRWIINRSLLFAIEEAYHGFLMQGRHPLAVINIEIDPERVDINVHPSKTEIKFQDERMVFSAVQRAVRAALIQNAPVPVAAEGSAYPQMIERLSPAARPTRVQQEMTGFEAAQQPATPKSSLPLLRALGQIGGSYILAEGPDGLFIIDQHAAHERVQLERILKQRENLKADKQGLLEPATWELEPGKAGLLKEHLRDLENVGFELEVFGPRAFLVRAVPAVLERADWRASLREFVDNLSSGVFEDLAVILACHSAVLAGQILSLNEMQDLLRQLSQTALPNSCPHGRPTMLQMPFRQLEKEFGRR
jgi:DNA mismatch repair protein MutL